MTVLAWLIGYTVTAMAFLVAAIWGHGAAGESRAAQARLLGVGIGLAAVQALIWVRFGAGLGG